MLILQQRNLHRIGIPLSFRNHILNRVRGPRRQAHGDIVLRRGLASPYFAVGVRETVHGCGREAKGHGDFAAPDGGRGVDGGDVAEHARTNLVAVEGGFVVAEAGESCWLSVSDQGLGVECGDIREHFRRSFIEAVFC